MEPCKFEDRIIEMSENVKVLLSEFKAMNGSLRSAKEEINCHIDESKPYRKKVDEIWAGIHFTKYVILLLFGTGLLFKLIEKVFK